MRIISPEDPDLILAWAVPGVAFGYPGTAIGEASVTERDKIAADHDAATIELLRDRLRSRESVLATASGPNGPLAAGSYQLAGRHGGDHRDRRAAGQPPTRAWPRASPARWRRTRWPAARERCSCRRPTRPWPAPTPGSASARSAPP